MKKQIFALLLALLLIGAGAILPAAAEEEESEPVETASETASEEETESEETVTSTVSHGGTTPVADRYIADDSVYYASIGEIGTVSTVEVVSTDGVSSAAPQTRKNIADPRNAIKRWLWLPIAVIVICLLVLIGFNQTYKKKYEAIDPARKRGKKPQHPAAPRQGSANGNAPRRPRD